MLVSIFLSFFFPLTQEIFQNPNLKYIFQTLDLTHNLNASNPQLAKDCWICLSITPLGNSAWPHPSSTGPLVTYPYTTHTVESLYMSQILNIFTLMIKSEIRTNLESLLTDLPSYNGKPPIGGPIAQKVTLLQPAPFCISRNSQNSL